MFTKNGGACYLFSSPKENWNLIDRKVSQGLVESLSEETPVDLSWSLRDFRGRWGLETKEIYDFMLFQRNISISFICPTTRVSYASGMDTELLSLQILRVPCPCRGPTLIKGLFVQLDFKKDLSTF